MDGTMQPQMPWAESLQSWTPEPRSPSWTESLWEQQKGWTLMVAEADEEIHKQVQDTAILARATQAHINLHVTAQQEDPTLETVIKWISNQHVTESETAAVRWCKYWGGENYPLGVVKANTLSRSSLPLPYTIQWVGRCFAVHSPHGSLSSHHEWMSSRNWALGSAVNTVLATWPVLVARHGHPLWAMHPAWRHLCQSSNAAHHCYCTFGIVTHWLYQY